MSQHIVKWIDHDTEAFNIFSQQVAVALNAEFHANGLKKKLL